LIDPGASRRCALNYEFKTAEFDAAYRPSGECFHEGDSLHILSVDFMPETSPVSIMEESSGEISAPLG
jgi:hypothetical protein